RQYGEEGRRHRLARDPAQGDRAPERQDQQSQDDTQREAVLEEPQPFPPELRPVQTRLHHCESKVHASVFNFRSASAISNPSANKAPSTIHHQNRCCKMPARLIFARTADAAAAPLSAWRSTCHTFMAAGEST